MLTSIGVIFIILYMYELMRSRIPFNFARCMLFASCIQQKLHLRVTSRIRRTCPPLHNCHYVIRGPQLAGYMEARVLSCTRYPASYTAAPRRTARGPSNLCPFLLPTLITIHSSYGCEYVKDRCEELEMSAGHFQGPTDHF